MGQQQRIARNTALAIIGVAGAGLVRFVFTMVTGRAFGSEILGDIAVIIAVATIVTIPAAGVGAAGNRFLAVASGVGNPTMRTEILGATWRGSLLVTGIAVISSWTYLSLQNSAQVDATAMTLGLAFVVVYALYLTGKGVLFGDGKASVYAIGEVAGVAAFTGSLTIVILASASAEWVLLTQVFWASAVVVAAVSIGVGPTKLRGKAPGGLWSFASTATVGSLVSLGITQATVLVMSPMHGSEQAGLLAAAVAITAPLYLLPRGLSLALTPAMSFHVGASAQKRANLDASYTTTLLVLFGAVSAASIIVLDDFVLGIYGAEFADAATFVAVFAVASFVAITGIPVVNRFASEGPAALRLTVIASALGAVGAVVIWFTLGRTDPTWIALGFLTSSIVKVAVPFALSRRVTGELIVPGIGVSLLAASSVGAAFLPQPWPFIALPLLVVVSLPAVFVATARYRARVASNTSASRPFTVGVVTNMYPTPGKPNFGVFVRDRVLAYQSLGASVVTVAADRVGGPDKYPRLALISLVSLVRKPVPDVFEAHYIAPTGVIAMLMAWIVERPYVLYAHGGDVTIVPRSRTYRRLLDLSVSRAAEIHTNSDHMEIQIQERWSPEVPIFVIPPGVQVPAEPDLDDARDIDVLFVGNLIYRKGADVLIEALPFVDVHRPIRVVIVGGGPEMENLTSQANAASLVVSFPGAVEPEEVHGLMATARVVAVPSRDEPLGQVAVEALAQGTPIVVSATGGLASIPTAACGTLVPPENPRALAAALQSWVSLTGEARLSAARSAHERAGDFEISRVAAAALEHLRGVTERAPSHRRVRTLPDRLTHS